VQRTSNIYRLVTIPSVYLTVQWMLRADAARDRYVGEVVRPEPGMRVLDCACGPASILPHLPSVDYLGIDLNSEHIAFAQGHYGDRGRFVVGDVTRDLDGLDGGFDLVLVTALLHHLDDDEARKVLGRAVELTRRGGRVVTLDSVWLPRQNPVAMLFNKFDSGLNVRTEEGYSALVQGAAGVSLETRIYRDFFWLPYDHICMTLNVAE
jgi:SAM-dependent methyltransferase